MARTPLFRWMGNMLRVAMASSSISSTVPKPSHPHQDALKNSSVSDTPISRRDFLKTTLGATGALLSLSLLEGTSTANAAWPLLTRHSSTAHQPPLAIVGGGLGGLVTAYRLHQQGVRCELYEASHRLGGRVFTRSNFNHEGMFVELGGELIDTGHEDIIALCQELHVPLEHFVQDELGIEPAIYYSDGSVYTEAQVLEAFRGLAQNLANDLKHCFPDGDIHVPTYLQPASTLWLDRLSLADYLHHQRDVVPAWLLNIIRTAYIGEYGLEPEEQSALNLVLLISADTDAGFRLFGDSDESMRVKGGNSRLVDALVHALKPHVPIHYGHRLTHLAIRKKQLQPSDNTIQADPSSGTLQLGMTVGKSLRWVNAPYAVLALPFATLRHVSGLDQIGLTPLKQQCIQEWGYGTNSKQMVGFQSRFWRADHPNVPANSGELITDLDSQCYWETSRLQPGKAGILTNFLGGEAGAHANANQWKIVLEDLKPLFGDLESQRDGHTAFFNWSQYAWNQGSYTCPKPGQYTSLVGAAQIPDLDDHLFFAGEHCSLNSAGYMNGAVESGNAAARQIMEKLARTAAFTTLATLA